MTSDIFDSYAEINGNLSNSSLYLSLERQRDFPSHCQTIESVIILGIFVFGYLFLIGLFSIFYFDDKNY